MMFQAGDIAACFGAQPVSRLIEYGTASLLAPARLRIGPSHVAMLCEHKEAMSWVESTSLCRRACLVQRRIVRGTQVHHPCERVRDYVANGGRVDVYRLSPIYRFSESESRLLAKILIEHFVRLGIGYDLGGALLAGTRVFKCLRLFPRADLDQLFCSELLAAVLMRLGQLNHGNPTKYTPAGLLRVLVNQGTYQYASPAVFAGGPGAAHEYSFKVQA